MGRNLKAAAVAAVCALMASGCVSTPEHWGPQAELPKPLAATMPVEVRVVSEEIAVHVPAGNAMAYGGGLLGVLVQTAVDNARAKGAEGRVAEIRDLMAGNDYRTVSREMVENHLDRGLVAPELDIETRGDSIQQQLAAGELTTRRDVMVIEHDYYFHEQFQHVQVELVARIGDRVVDDKRMNEENMRYYNRFYYTAPLPGVDSIRGRDERAEAWFALGADAIDAMIRDGMRETVEMLNHDLAGARGETQGTRTQIYTRGITGYGPAVGRNARGDRVWVRERNVPFLHSVSAP